MKSIREVIKQAAQRDMLPTHLDEMASANLSRRSFPTLELFRELKEVEQTFRDEFSGSPLMLAWGTQMLREASISGKRRSPAHIFSKEHTKKELNAASAQAERGIADLIELAIEQSQEEKEVTALGHGIGENLRTVQDALESFPLKTSRMLKASRTLLSPLDPRELCDELIEYLNNINLEMYSEANGIKHELSLHSDKARELLLRLGEVSENQTDRAEVLEVASVLKEVRSELVEIRKLAGKDEGLSRKELVFLSRVQFTLEAAALTVASINDTFFPELTGECTAQYWERLRQVTDQYLDKQQLIVHSNWRLALWQAQKFWPGCDKAGLAPGDILSMAYEGLLNATERFDPALGMKFSTFAVETIRGYIRRRSIVYRYGVSYRSRGLHATKLQDSIWDETSKHCERPPLDGIALVRDAGPDEELRERLQRDSLRQPFSIVHLPEDSESDFQFQELSGPLDLNEYREGFSLTHSKLRMVPLEPDLFTALCEAPEPEGKYIVRGGDELKEDIGLLRLLLPSEVEEFMRINRSVVSLDQPFCEDDLLPLEGDRVLESDGEPDPNRLAASHCLRESLKAPIEQPGSSLMERELYEGKNSFLNQLLAKLPERSQSVVRLRFGIDCDHPHTLAEIGEQLGLTSERVRQIENNSLESLKLALKRDGDQDLLAQGKSYLW